METPSGSHHCLVLDLCECDLLHKLEALGGAMRRPVLWGVFRQVLAALQHCHDNGELSRSLQ